jgi:hypothetical protein
MSKLSVRILSFKPLRSNTLVGFVDLVIPDLHLEIYEATVHQSGGRRWVGLPAKAQIDRDGRVRRDERGKVLYSAVLRFNDNLTRDAFSERVVEALIAERPRAFDAAPSTGAGSPPTGSLERAALEGERR